uniref:Reverse transcriptase domain-containing protein n=1 Tax=Knipowitschia caucasica TaxID=637954 RepID=A0AAV2L7G4_KNICA
MHTDASLSTREDMKPQMILDYNSTKGGVDNLDKVTATYSCQRKTARWPLVIFYNIVDVSAYNAYVLWTAINQKWNAGKLYRRRLFLEELGKALVTPKIQMRAKPARSPAAAAVIEKVKISHDSVKLIKFADDTTLIGLISNNDESAYRREVDRLVSWCSGNNLELNAQKTVEMIVDFRKSTVPPPPPSVMDSPITSVESFRFLGTTITQDLKWEPTISSLIKKAQQRMYFLRQLRKAKLPAQMLVQFYTAIIESILTSSITVWFAGATVRDKQRLQRIVRSAEEVIGRSLPSLQDLQEAAVHQD